MSVTVVLDKTVYPQGVDNYEDTPRHSYSYYRTKTDLRIWCNTRDSKESRLVATYGLRAVIKSTGEALYKTKEEI